MSVTSEAEPLAKDTRSQAPPNGGRVRHRTLTAIAPFVRRGANRVRARHLIVADTIGLTIAALIALALWAEARDTAPPLAPYAWVIVIIVATRTGADIVLGLYGRSWRHASVPEMAQIIACTTVGTIFSVAIANAVGQVSAALMDEASVLAAVPSAPFWLLEWSVALVVIAAPRFAIRYASELRRTGNGATVEARRSLLYGAGWAGVTVARSAVRNPDGGVEPVGFLDDDPDLEGRRVAGLRVFGDLTALPRAIRKTHATVLLITMPGAPGDTVRRIAETAMEHGLMVRTVPPVTDLIDGTLDATRIRKLRVEDLLRRAVSSVHTPSVHEVFTGKTIVITGAAGSIGSELARQVTAVEPRRVLLVDQAESPLFQIEREFQERLAERQVHGHRTAIEITAHLMNVADRAAVTGLFKRERPDVVLHAAAYKHVPMLEDHPAEAVRTNIGGTLSVVDAAADAAVGRLVFVSTDKAVWPSSVMGASKRIAEMIVADAGLRLGRPYISVRFGNVLGSNGSVVPIFQDQLERGLPLPSPIPR